MKFTIIFVQVFSLVFILGCSSKGDSLNRLLYETGQGYDQQQCRQDPTAECNSRKSYEQYKREREVLLKKENKFTATVAHNTDNAIQEVTPINQEVEACPYPADPINWILRYCAFENHTGDEIALQNSKCFKEAQPDLFSKGNSCQIKGKYKLKYCEAVVKQHKTHKTAQLCLEDHSVKPFFAGN